MQPTPQDDQLMSKHRVLSLKPQLRLEWRGHDGQSETEQPDHSASLGDSITSSTRIRFSVHTGSRVQESKAVTRARNPGGGFLLPRPAVHAGGFFSGFLAIYLTRSQFHSCQGSSLRITCVPH